MFLVEQLQTAVSLRVLPSQVEWFRCSVIVELFEGVEGMIPLSEDGSSSTSKTSGCYSSKHVAMKNLWCAGTCFYFVVCVCVCVCWEGEKKKKRKKKYVPTSTYAENKPTYDVPHFRQWWRLLKIPNEAEQINNHLQHHPEASVQLPEEPSWEMPIRRNCISGRTDLVVSVWNVDEIHDSCMSPEVPHTISITPCQHEEWQFSCPRMRRSVRIEHLLASTTSVPFISIVLTSRSTALTTERRWLKRTKYLFWKP